jgi:hypothetical protein
VLRDGLVLLPTGAGTMMTLPRGDLRSFRGGAWLDAAQVIFTASLGDGRPRVYRQTIPDGTPLPITPEDTASGLGSVRDDRTVLVRSGDRWWLYPVDVGGPAPVAVPALGARDVPVAWSDDGRFVYTTEPVSAGNATRFDVIRVELATGGRDVWKTLAPVDTAGIQILPASFRMLADGSAYCYSYMRRLGDLFVVQGLQ